MTNKLPWEAGKEYILENGLKARIYAIDAGGRYPIHGAYLDKDETWYPLAWPKTGRMDVYSLVLPEKPKIKGEVWVLVRDGGAPLFCTSKEEAKNIMKNYPENNYAVLYVPYELEPGVRIKFNG